MFKTPRIRITGTLVLMLLMTACSYNPFRTNNEMTGNLWGAGIGAAAGVGTAAIVGNSSSFWYGVAGLTGASIGYYVTSLRFASAGIIQSGGQVFTLGDYVTIEVPTDELFDSNTADLLPNAEPIMKSVVSVINRYPNNNILVSGNTSGFGSSRFEHKLSEDRARTISSYLWANGVSNLQFQEVTKTRKLNYVGYGNYFPIANHIKTEGIRANSRIQITVYPTKEQLQIDKKMKNFNNIGAVDDAGTTFTKPEYVDNAFPQGDVLPEESSISQNDFKDSYTESPRNAVISPNEARSSDYFREGSNNLKGNQEGWQDYSTVEKTPPPPPMTAPSSADIKETTRPAFRGYKDEVQ